MVSFGAGAACGVVSRHVYLPSNDSIDCFDFLRAQGEPLDDVEADGGDEVLRPEKLQQLSVVDFRDKDALEVVQDLAEVLRERVQVAQVRVGHGVPPLAQALHGVLDRPVRASPSDDEDLALWVALDGPGAGYRPRCARSFPRAS